MSLIDRGESVLAWTKAAGVWILMAGIVLLALLLFGQCRGRRDAVDALKRAQDAAAIDKAGLVRSHEVEVRELAASLDAEKRKSATFEAAMKDAQRKLHDARVISVVSASTGPQPVQPAQGAAPQPGAVPACVLTEGDQGEIEVREATLETQMGNRVVVGSAEAYRSNPRRLLFAGPFAVPLTEAAEVAFPKPERSGWGAGALAGLSSGGLQVGAIVETPEGKVPILGGRVAGVAQAIGGSGQFSVQAGFIYRP